jgi:hypothetical protein
MEDLDRDVNVLATGETIEAALETALTDQGQAVATVGVDQLYGSVSAMPSRDGPRGRRELLGRTHDDVALRSWRSALFAHPRPRWHSGPPGLHLARNVVSRHRLHENPLQPSAVPRYPTRYPSNAFRRLAPECS